MYCMKFLVAFALSTALNAFAEVALITQISGDIVVATSSNKQPAVSFSKVDKGDTLVLGNGARLNLVYLASGRQEIWKGSAQVEIGARESKSANKPEVSQLPAVVVSQLAKLPPARQQGGAGMLRMRSFQTADLDKQYGDLKRNAEPDDTTPEAYLLAGLIELRDLKRARSLLSELESKPNYKSLVEYFAPMVTIGGK